MFVTFLLNQQCMVIFLYRATIDWLPDYTLLWNPRNDKQCIQQSQANLILFNAHKDAQAHTKYTYTESGVIYKTSEGYILQIKGKHVKWAGESKDH